MDRNKFEQFQKLVDNSKNIVFFGGAGVSTASGIPDFRSENGLYGEESKRKHKYSPEYMLSHTFYKDNTEEFFEFYKTEMCALGYKPNDTHYKLAELEKVGKLKAVITQNIDGLHQLAGSKNVIELHGTIHKNTCTECSEQYTAEYVKNSIGIPRCKECGGIIKPDVTLYEEMLPYGVLTKARRLIRQADLVIVAGTSLNVQPAAGLLSELNGAKLVIINKTETPQDYIADLLIKDDMTEVFSELKA